MTVCLCYRKSIKSFSCAKAETAIESQSKGLKEQYVFKTWKTRYSWIELHR